jgi:nucleoside-diphosphate-sugar epimerase
MQSTICIVTGAAEFIGFHLSQKLTKHEFNVIGLDNINAIDAKLSTRQYSEISRLPLLNGINGP